MRMNKLTSHYEVSCFRGMVHISSLSETACASTKISIEGKMPKQDPTETSYGRDS